LVSHIKGRGLRVFENRVLRRILGPKRVDVTGDWRKLHSEEFNNLYSLQNIIHLHLLRMDTSVSEIFCEKKHKMMSSVQNVGHVDEQ
jgi:hypothetical protein